MENKGKATTASSSRWNPTKEQITLLENFYNEGIRTPSADQIHQITGRLRAYGHIEGKNVFYWFQNHKARQRQKQKQDRTAYFNRFIHKTSRFFHPLPCLNVGCVSPYYLQQVNDHHNQHGSGYRQDLHSNNLMLPSGSYEKHTITDQRKHLSDKTTIARRSMSSSSLRFDRFAHSEHCSYGEDINVNSHGSKTLPLFPLQPLNANHATDVDGVGDSSLATGHDFPATYFGDGGGRGQPFIDFFSGGSCRFDNSGNGL